MAVAANEVASDELRPEYDIRSIKGAVRGKYTVEYLKGFGFVKIDEDLAGEFPDAASVNAALREYVQWRHERHPV